MFSLNLFIFANTFIIIRASETDSATKFEQFKLLFDKTQSEGRTMGQCKVPKFFLKGFNLVFFFFDLELLQMTHSKSSTSLRKALNLFSQGCPAPTYNFLSTLLLGLWICFASVTSAPLIKTAVTRWCNCKLRLNNISQKSWARLKCFQRLTFMATNRIFVKP